MSKVPMSRVQIHEHGFIELLDVMASDEDIESAARVSYTGGDDEERTVGQRRHLIRYLMRHYHTTPFEMAVMKFRVALPIFVERQMIRHRTASTNEFSGRYAEMPDLFFCPTPERIRKQSKLNKQGSADESLEDPQSWVNGFKFETGESRANYKDRLHFGMAKELSRINLPLSQYTVKVWKMDLHNLLHFLRLRLHPHAQEEIRDYADPIAKMVAQHFPLTWEAFEDYRLHAVTFSRIEMEVVRDFMNARNVEDHPSFSALSQRERREFLGKLGVGE